MILSPHFLKRRDFMVPDSAPPENMLWNCPSGSEKLQLNLWLVQVSWDGMRSVWGFLFHGKIDGDIKEKWWFNCNLMVI
jgi:hypothetical protein